MFDRRNPLIGYLYFSVSNLLKYIENMAGGKAKNHNYLNRKDSMSGMRGSGTKLRRKSSIRGLIRRTCSIQVEPGDIPGKMLHINIAYPTFETCLLY